MNRGESDNILAKFAPRRQSPIAISILAIATSIIGASLGWIAHARFGQLSEIERTLYLVMDIAAKCSGMSSGELRRTVEKRLNRPFSLFDVQDKLYAIELAFDNIEVSACVPPRAVDRS